MMDNRLRGELNYSKLGLSDEYIEGVSRSRLTDKLQASERTDCSDERRRLNVTIMRLTLFICSTRGRGRGRRVSDQAGIKALAYSLTRSQELDGFSGKH